ncbi:MAG: folylpolyglutamate synthase/dihydrofolate synthase family protein [Candidatus Omnitrophota bacterium]
MTYSQALKYLDSFINYEKIGSYSAEAFFKLERIERLLKALGNPHKDFTPVHIAGTKGKGSACAFLHSILKAAGKKAGLYTSPHLVDFRERIRIEELISKKHVCELIGEIQPHAQKLRKDPELGELSFFEVYTALAFLYFAKKKIEYAVIETGLGGRLDATNIVNAKAAGITQISHDHMQQLGADLGSIAREKAGIIKTKARVVSARQVSEVEDILDAACRAKKAKLYKVGSDLTYNRIAQSLNGQIFNLNGIGKTYLNLKIKLLGSHQIENAAIAVALSELLGVNKETDIRKGLEAASWPGRFDIVCEKPLVILDGAQNAASARALRSAIQEIFPDKKFILVFGVSADKDASAIAKELFPLVSRVFLTRANSPRALEPKELADRLGAFSQKVCLKDSVKQAIKDAKAISNGDAVLVTGSLYIVGEAMDYLK